MFLRVGGAVDGVAVDAVGVEHREVRFAFRQAEVLRHRVLEVEPHGDIGLSASGVHIVFAELTSGATASSTRQLLASTGFRPAGEVAEFFKDGCSRLTLAKVLPVTPTPVVAVAEPLKTIAAPLIG